MFAAQSGRITSAVITLMMLMGYSGGHFDQRFIQFIQQLKAQLSMLFHDFKFARCQTTGFMQNLIRYSNFANIMQGRCNLDHG